MQIKNEGDQKNWQHTKGIRLQLYHQPDLDWKTDLNKMAQELDTVNRERQIIERGIASEAEWRAETEFADAPGIVLFNEDWHPGVVAASGRERGSGSGAQYAVQEQHSPACDGGGEL